MGLETTSDRLATDYGILMYENSTPGLETTIEFNNLNPGDES